MCTGTSISLGLICVARDLGFVWELRVETDATAAIGVCRRRGLGRIRHLATADLWIQDRLRSGDFSLVKIPGEHNTSDILTKHVNRQILEKHLHTLGLYLESGRSSLAPTLEHTLAPP